MSLKTGAVRDLPGQTIPVFAAWPRKPVSARLASHPPVARILLSVPSAGPHPQHPGSGPVKEQHPALGEHGDMYPGYGRLRKLREGIMSLRVSRTTEQDPCL